MSAPTITLPLQTAEIILALLVQKTQATYMELQAPVMVLDAKIKEARNTPAVIDDIMEEAPNVVEA